MGPRIINKLPDEGDLGIDPREPVRFGVRDEDTQADISSLKVALGWGKSFYDPDQDVVLPEEVARLSTSPRSVTWARAGDTATSGPVGSVEGGDAHREVHSGELLVEKTAPAGERQDGTLYVRDELLEATTPVMAHLSWRYDPDTTPFQANYTTFSDYMGVLGGMIHGPTKKAVLLFLCYDGANYYLRVCSPATDGSGSRTEHGTLTLSGPESRCKIFWDTKDSALKVMEGPEDSEVVEVDLSLVGELLPSVSVGGMTYGVPRYEATVFLGLDGNEPGDLLYQRSVGLQTFTYYAVYEGNPQASIVSKIASSSSIAYDGEEEATESDPSPWFAVLEGGASLSLDGGTRIEKGSSGKALVRRDEVFPALPPGWMLELRFSAQDLSHPGHTPMGAGALVCDGASACLLMLINDYETTHLGVYNPGGGHDLDVQGNYETGEFAWGTSAYFVLVLDRASSTLLVLDEDGEKVLSMDPSSLSGVVALLGCDAGVELGHVADVGSGDSSGSFTVEQAKFLPNAELYDPSSGLPGPPWVEEVLEGEHLIEDDELVAVDEGYGDEGGPEKGYAVHTFPLPAPLSDLGASLFWRMTVASWTDTVGSPAPTGTPISCGVGVFDGTQAAFLRFVDSGTEKYVYIPGSDAEGTLEDVLARSEEGRARSAALDFELSHSYLLLYQPRRGIYLFVDGAKTPSIELPWGTSGFDLPSEPLSWASSCAFMGSYDPWRACEASFRNVVIGNSRGYDVSLSRVENEEEIQERMSDAMLNTVIRIGD